MLLRRTPAAALAGLASLAVLTGCAGGTAAPAAAGPTVPASSAAAPTSAAAAPAPAVHGALLKGVTGPILAAVPLRPDRSTVGGGIAAVTASRDKAHRLAGLTIVLDPGHNGGNGADPGRLNAPVPAGGFTKPCNTTGAETNAGYPEHAFNWDVVNRAAALLRAAGARVVLTRHSDTGFGPCVNVRAATGNAAHADAVVAVHADGAASSAYGFHVIAPALSPDRGNAKILARSWALAEAVHTAFHTVAGEPYSTYVSGGLTRRSDLAGLNLSRVPAIFIECANMRNAGDASRVASATWRQRAAAGIVAGVTAFLHR
ncbi:MAG: N-acetylmuramoyl-L-alanine amidase [Frankiales bacterium]|jgi:N-acetylmuramoyl-L-alanine amidase|nr:N-acetylmuramoyl-L-alanine amidase [Frankiales bacterium]